MSTGWLTEGTVNLFIDATPEAVYRAVSDVTGTSGRSSECRNCTWLSGDEPGTVGSRFRGRNCSGIFRWSRVCEVTVARHGEAFAYRTVPERIDPSRKDSTTWRFDLTEDG